MGELLDEEKTTANSLINSWFRPATDTFTPISYSLQPLPFDRVSDGCPIASKCPVFRLPVELHSGILCHLDNVDLAHLALVDQDCRQLARSAQFSSVHLSIRPASLELLTKVLYENIDDNNRDHRNSRRLGPCVRRLVVGSNWYDVQDVVGAGARNLCHTDTPIVVDAYEALISLLSSCMRTSFPNLELVQIADRVPIQPELIESLSGVSLRHLVVDNFAVGNLYQGQERTLRCIRGMLEMSPWPDMRSLDVSLHYDEIVEQDATWRVLLMILRAAAPSIEGLRLCSFCYLGSAFANSLPNFPRLQRLHLEVPCKDERDEYTFLRKVLPFGGSAIKSLKSLQLNRVDHPHLLRLGHLSHLKKLVVNDYSLCSRPCDFAFLSANPQLELLSFTFPIGSQTLRERLLPTIHSSGFSSLRVLRLSCASSYLSRRVIAAIGLLPSLEMLWLSAGRQTGWQYDWFIDHSELKKGLKGLQRLKELAFTRESYHCKLFRRSADEHVRLAYYAFPFLPPGASVPSTIMAEDADLLRDLDSTESDGSLWTRRVYLWEEWHREQMRTLAGEYAALFPLLKFIFVGEYPIEVVCEKGQDTRSRRIIFLSVCRQTYLKELSRKWGSQTV